MCSPPEAPICDAAPPMRWFFRHLHHPCCQVVPIDELEVEPGLPPVCPICERPGQRFVSYVIRLNCEGWWKAHPGEHPWTRDDHLAVGGSSR